jgi:succinyl-CoA--D-citramalate CoA-transferase
MTGERLPLSDVRVVEMGTLIAGPFGGQLLADFGAEVIKVEPPGMGDPMRGWGRIRKDERTLWWPVIGRNKKSITLNLREAEGQDLARRLIATADILIENFRPGTLERWGLDYERLSAENPGLIMVRISGYGQTGPYSSRAGFGSIGEAMGGLRNITGFPDLPPPRMGVSIGDSLAATYGTLGAMIALHNRDANGGKGQVVDLGIYEAVLAMMESTVPEYALTGYVRERTGSVLPGLAPSNIYPTRDGAWAVIGANADNVFRRLADATDHPEWANDSRFATHEARGEHQQQLDDLISDWTRERTIDDVLEVMSAGGVPAGKVYTAADMLEDPQSAARENIVRVEDATLGEVPMTNVVPRLTDTPGTVRWTGPELGQHNDEVYAGILGLSDEARADLRERGVI